MAVSTGGDLEAVEGKPQRKKAHRPFSRPENRLEAAKLLIDGHTQAEVAEKFGVSQMAVSVLARSKDAQEFMAALREQHADKLSALYETSIVSLITRIGDSDTNTRDYLNLLRRAMEVVLGQTTPGRPTLPAAVPPAVVIDQRQGPAQPTMTMAQLVAQAAQMAQNQQHGEEEE